MSRTCRVECFSCGIVEGKKCKKGISREGSGNYVRGLINAEGGKTDPLFRIGRRPAEGGGKFDVFL